MRFGSSVVFSLILAVPVIAGLARSGVTSEPKALPRQGETTPVVGQAGAPEWEFMVLSFRDPYQGEVQQPVAPGAGMRYVGVQVQITNGSDQALAFSISDVKLSEAEGIEYRAGEVIGSEPRLRSRNLNPGERARGWVWFEVPIATQLAQLIFVAPRPEFRVALPSGAAT